MKGELGHGAGEEKPRYFGWQRGQVETMANGGNDAKAIPENGVGLPRFHKERLQPATSRPRSASFPEQLAGRCV